MSVEHKFEKLPIAVIPKHYNIHLTPNLETFNFVGEVAVDIEIQAETDEITLNSLNLDFDSVKLKNVKNEYAPIKTTFIFDEEKVVIKFDTVLAAGNYNLYIQYKGKLEDNMRGFYRSKYIDDKGKEYYSALTQFAPADARRCFPCWDEPAHKATFDIALTTSKSLTTLSNTSVQKTIPSGDVVKYFFKTTPKMSTYLAAFIVGHYDFVEKKSSDGVLIRVYTPLEKKQQGEFALDVASKVLPYYKEYFKIAYPLPKLDLVAVASLSYGAMENWGLITYREQRLLIDPKNSSTANKQDVALVVAHELAHQWFGNLVTMKWWTDLWLNEGYATFTQFLVTDYLFPEYNIWSQFVNTYFLAALELDSLRNSHSIEVAVHNPSEINQIFDAITYNKGASIIRMLFHFIGNEKFREGMSLYLKRYQYGNTSTEDLWNALEEASKEPVAKIMSTWTKQMGFPLIKVETTSISDGTKVKLSQTKFTADGTQSENCRWMVPISISSSSNPSGTVSNILLTEESTEITIFGLKSTDWIKVNPGVVGFYRTQYTDDMLNKFSVDIRNQTLPPLDRLGLLEDTYALVKAGYMNTGTLLNFLKNYEKETDSNVWISIITILNKLETILDYTDTSDLFRNYRKQLVQNIFKSVGWEPKPNDSHIDTLLRGKILEHFSSLQDEDIINEARSRFLKHVNGEKLLPADIRVGCYKIVVSSGSEKEFDSMFQLYKTTDLNEEKMRIINGLGFVKTSHLIKKLLDIALSEHVKTQDGILVLISASKTTLGRELTWQFIKENWDGIRAKFTAGPLLQNLIKQVTHDFATQQNKDDLEEFFSKNKNAWIDKSVQQVLESITVNVAWLKRDSQAIREYLSSQATFVMK
ncbi:unnamed protein product [Psylliodes chrysocephalus]|uniref:Aminopeptidase n=1 Tax=Psylliodes chrysocephalus TaxID=3402493 RepID=A0A9P0CRS8_9CUCU|nr:unnamed protein product [Psylliodes chrysocephala]